jgi:hypothetical protein
VAIIKNSKTRSASGKPYAMDQTCKEYRLKGGVLNEQLHRTFHKYNMYKNLKHEMVVWFSGRIYETSSHFI